MWVGPGHGKYSTRRSSWKRTFLTTGILHRKFHHAKFLLDCHDLNFHARDYTSDDYCSAELGS